MSIRFSHIHAGGQPVGADDVALGAWSGCQVEHEARVDVGKRIDAQVTLEVMALVDNRDGIELGDDLNVQVVQHS